MNVRVEGNKDSLCLFGDDIDEVKEGDEFGFEVCVFECACCMCVCLTHLQNIRGWDDDVLAGLVRFLCLFLCGVLACGE